MKDQMLKLAGVKTEKEFYKLFPTEEAFMAKYGKQVKKLQLKKGVKMAQSGLTQSAFDATNQALAMINEQGFNISQDQLRIPNLSTMQPKGMPPLQANPMAAFSKKPKKQDINWAQGVPIMGDIVQGIQQLRDEKEELASARQWEAVSDVALRASRTKPEEYDKRYVTPWDNVTSGNKLYDPYGKGTEILAKDGKKIPKAQYGTFLQGIGGAKPLMGKHPEFMAGFNQFADAGGVDTVSKAITALTGESGGDTLGGTIGGTIGSIFGPVGSAFGQLAGQTIGGLIDTRPEKIEKARNAFYGNLDNIAMNNNASTLHSRNASYVRTGGNIRQNNLKMGGDLEVHEGRAKHLSYNPFFPGGGETVLFEGPSHEKGGMQISYGGNPVEVEGGEPAVELDKGGKLGSEMVVLGNLINPLTKQKFKKEGKELAMKEDRVSKIIGRTTKKLKDLEVSTPIDRITENSLALTLKGNTMKQKALAEEKEHLIALQTAILDTADEMGVDSDALSKGNIEYAKNGAKVSKAQNGDKYAYTKEGYEKWLKDNMLINNASNFNTYIRNLNQYRRIEEEKTNIAIREKEKKEQYQRDILKNAEDTRRYREYQIEKQKLKFGDPYYGETLADWTQRKYGTKTTEPVVVQESPVVTDNTAKTTSTTQSTAKTSGTGKKKTDTVKTVETPTTPASTQVDWTGMTPAKLRGELPGQFDENGVNRFFDFDIATGGPLASPKTVTANNVSTTNETTMLNPWITGINAMLPYIRPSDVEALDPMQLAGEMYALSSNQLEPVQTQTYQPQLSTPYDVSLQEIRNENQADYNAAKRMIGYNPAALSMLNAQKYAANQKVGAEEFRINQAVKDKVFAENRDLLNKAKLVNLELYDKQYERQNQAKSATDEATLAALNSISDKYLKNRFENRTLATYENMYNYRFDRNGRAWNWNPLAQFDTTLGGKPGRGDITGIPDDWTVLYDEDRNFAGVKKKTKSETDSRNGSIVRAFKNL